VRTDQSAAVPRFLGAEPRFERYQPTAIAAALPHMQRQKSAHITDPESATAIQTFYQGCAIPADSFARAVAFAMTQPEEVDVNEILFRPTSQQL
jgi:NADP-dependent 3-hydroxy acid dehydrogenase YdfG